MIFKLRVFLRLLQSIFGSARRTSPFLFQLIAAYLKLKFGFGTRKWSKSRTEPKARNGSDSSTENTEKNSNQHTTSRRRSLFHSAHFSKLSLDFSKWSSKAMNRVKSIKHARKDGYTLARLPKKMPMLSLPSTTPNMVTFDAPSQAPAIIVTAARVTPNMEVVRTKSLVENPELWRTISAPLRTHKTIHASEWQVQGRKRRNVKKSENVTKTEMEASEDVTLISVHTHSLTKTFATGPKAAPGSFYTFENPYQVLEGLDDDAFQVAQVKQRNFSKESPLSPPVPVERNIDVLLLSTPKPVLISKPIGTPSPITSSPIKIPGILPVWNSTQTLAKAEKHPVSAPESVKYTTADGDLDVARIIKNRRRQNARSPTQPFKKVPILAPTRDAVETFRKASSPSRSVSPSKPNTENNEWQPVQRRRRRVTGLERDSNFGEVQVLDLGPTLNTLPVSVTNTALEGASPVILYKVKRPTVSV